jgi:hypothetical protein
MKSRLASVSTVRLPFSGTPTVLKIIRNITCEVRNMMTVMGSILPTSAAKIEPPAVSSHSLAVACLSSVPTAKIETMMVKISSIIGMKLGER